MLCALTASAVSYATPYMGSGKGFIHTTSSARVHSIGNGGGGLASAPVATMGSVNGRGVSSSTVASTGGAYASVAVSSPRVHSGIYTSASAISGGVTTEDTGHHHPHGGVRTETPWHPGDPGNPCPNCIDEDGDEICDICGEETYECTCDPCHCPLDEEWHVWLFVSLIVALYALIKVKRERLAVKRETI